MRCPNCASLNAAGARFCANCGFRLTTECSYCSAEAALGQRFCGNCGGRLDELLSPALQRAPGDPAATAERRLVSVVFVDLEGFTALAERLDPEDVRALQDRYFALARSLVTRYGGSIEKYVGDAVMAVWGAIPAHEDDALRAVRAALEIVSGVERLTALGQPLRARAAVGTGEAAVTHASDGQGMLAGDVVNTVARLQQAAPSGTVLVDGATRRAAGRAVEFEPAGATDLRGKSRAIAAWRATTVKDSSESASAVAHPGPFVGRKRELAELTDLYRRVAQERRSRLVSVHGIAGIGKSRLAWEFERKLRSLSEPPQVLGGRCLSYGEGISFAPLAEMIRRFARLPAGEDRDAQLVVLDELLPSSADSGEREWLRPRLAALLEPTEQAYERDDLFAAWRRFFEQAAARRPLVLLFEDLQWADPALLDFIEYLSSWSRAHALLVVTLARPELLDRHPRWGAEQPSFTSLQLGPLSELDMAALLRALAPTVDDEGLARIVARAGGVPLYGVEVARMLRGGGDLEIDKLPEALHALVAARIDALPASTRTLLLSAAVLGRRFDAAELSSLHGREPAAIREPLALLVRRELLTVHDGPPGRVRVELSFVQDVVRDVSYRTLSRAQRRRLHLAAADRLERHDDSDAAEALAEHLYAACRAMPDDPQTALLAERAVEALRRAATRAAALHLPSQALAHLERALQLVDEGGLRAELWMQAASAARAAGEFQLAEDHLRRLVQWHVQNQDGRGAARARAQLAALMLASERHRSALLELEDALQSAEELEDEADVELAAQLARGRVLAGDDKHGLEWAERALAAAERLQLRAVEVDALITRGTARMRLWDGRAGRSDLRRAITRASRQGLLGAELRARNNLAWLSVLEDPHAAIATARAGLELARAMGVGDMVLQLGLVVARLAFDTGEWDLALDVIEQSRERPQAAAHRIQYAALEAELRWLRGESAALDVASLSSLDPQLDSQILADLDVARAWGAFVAGNHAEAQRLARAGAERALGADRYAALALAAHAAVWDANARALEELIGALDEFAPRGRVAVALRQTLAAAAAGLTGDRRAERLFASALAAWRSLNLPLHLAVCLAERELVLGAPAGELDALINELRAEGLRRLVAERRAAPAPL